MTLQPVYSSQYPIHVNISNVTLEKAKLKISRCNAVIQNSMLAMTELSYKVTESDEEYVLQLLNTFPGTVQIDHGKVHIANSTFGAHSVEKNDFSTVLLKASNITIERCTFQNISSPKGVAAIQGRNSTIKIKKTTFVGNQGSAGILNFTDHSHIEMHDSVLVNNISPGPVGGALTISGNSVAHI